jgi:hypothetical protein
MDLRAGWQTWACPCGRRWDLEHFHDLDGGYLGCSWILRRDNGVRQDTPRLSRL